MQFLSFDSGLLFGPPCIYCISATCWDLH